MKQLYIIITHPIQYFVPLYKKMSESGIKQKVFYCTDETLKGGVDRFFGIPIKWDIPLLDGYNFEFLKNYSWKKSMNDGFWGVLNLSLINIFRKSKKGFILVNGWMTASYVISIFFGKFFGHKIILRCEAPYQKEIRNSSIKTLIRHILLKKILFKYFVDYFFYIGKQNKLFYEFYKVPNDKMFFSPYSVDNDKFNPIYVNKSKKELRIEYGFDESDFIILFTGKLYELKRPFDLIKSFELLNIEKTKLIIVGEGILKDDIENYIKTNKLKNILITGFVNQSEIPNYYLLSDVFVLCSESETWGLSINEAMNFGLPIIAYDSVGCCEDLIKQGENGFIVKKGDVKGLANSIKYIHDNIDFREKAAKVSIEVVENYSYNKIIENFKNVLK